jgi:hypothetical protein
VLVKEDTFDPNELEAGKDLPESTGSTKNSTERVIVGVCSWKLEEGSRRKGEFQPPLLELDRCGEFRSSILSICFRFWKRMSRFFLAKQK